MFDFANMSVPEIIGQILGFCAMGIAFFSFQARRNKYIMLFQGLGTIFWVFHYLLLGSIVGAALNAIAMIRNFTYMFRDKMSPPVLKSIPFITAAAFTVVTVVTYESPISIIPYVGSIAATVAFFMKNENMLRSFSLVVSITWLIFNITENSIAGALNESLAIVSIVIALVRFGLVPMIKNKKAGTPRRKA